MASAIPLSIDGKSPGMMALANGVSWWLLSAAEGRAV